MILTLDQIRAVTTGADRVEKTAKGRIKFHRFTEAQEKAYKDYSADFYRKTFSTSGIRLEFVTDSKSLSMTVNATSKLSSSRRFFAHSVYADGKLVGRIERSQDDPQPDGDFSGEFDLGAGEKRVKIYFPWSAVSEIVSLELDDGATVKPVEKKCKMLIFGDSISQGYDALAPENSYASIVTDYFDADARNKGIGGEVFYPTLGALRDDFEPDYITVAYGTNDWSRNDRETFDRDCEAFYTNLSANYSESTIFAISPIWRGNYTDKGSKVGEFSHLAERIAEVADKLPNVIFINGFDFVPKDSSYFSDLYLHPDDKGFAHYAKNLIAELVKYIDVKN